MSHGIVRSRFVTLLMLNKGVWTNEPGDNDIHSINNVNNIHSHCNIEKQSLGRSNRFNFICPSFHPFTDTIFNKQEHVYMYVQYWSTCTAHVHLMSPPPHWGSCVITNDSGLVLWLTFLILISSTHYNIVDCYTTITNINGFNEWMSDEWMDG